MICPLCHSDNPTDLHLDPDMWHTLNRLAARTGTTLPSLCAQIIRLGLQTIGEHP